MKTNGKKGKKNKEIVKDLITDQPVVAASAAANGAPLEIHHGDIKAKARKIKE